MTATTGPLHGLRVVDVAGLPGAYGTMLLAALGADVIKVEPPGGDDLRHLPPTLDDVPAPENGLWFAFLGQGKRSVVIDATDETGRATLRRLLVGADLVVDSSPPDAFDSVGLGYAALSAENPRLSWISITPFGRTGPRRNWQGSNLIAWAAAGVLYTTGFADRPPVVPAGPVQLGCHLAAMNAAIAALLAVRARQITGRGQLADLSIAEACLALSPETGVPLFLDDRVHRPRGGNRRDITRPFGLYPCADGYVSILVLMPPHWRAMAEWINDVTGNDAFLEEAFGDMTVRREAADFVDEFTEAVTLAHTKAELFREGQRRGIPITPVNTVADLLGDPHLAHTGFFEKVEHPALGTYTRPGPPFRFDKPFWSLGRAPLLGEHTAEVLADLG